MMRSVSNLCCMYVSALIDLHWWLIVPGSEAVVYLLSPGWILGVSQSFSFWSFCSEEPDLTKAVWAEDRHPSADGKNPDYSVHCLLYASRPLLTYSWLCRPIRTQLKSSRTALPFSWHLMGTITKVWELRSHWDEPMNCWPALKRTCTRWGRWRWWWRWWWRCWWWNNVCVYRWKPTWLWLNVASPPKQTAHCSPAPLSVSTAHKC